MNTIQKNSVPAMMQNDTPLFGYAIYALVFSILAFPLMIFLNDPLGEMMSRNWLLSIALLIGPLTRLSLPWWKSSLITIPFCLLVVWAHGYIAYDMHQYRPNGPISHQWLAVSIVVYFSIAAAAAYAARRLTGQSAIRL